MSRSENYADEHWFESLCRRTHAVWKPGVPMPDTPHHYIWTGDIPLTGVLKCVMCSQTKES